MVTWIFRTDTKQIQEMIHLNLSAITSSWSALKAIRAGVFQKDWGLLLTIGTITIQLQTVCLGFTQHTTAYMTSLMGGRVRSMAINGRGHIRECVLVIDGWAFNPDTLVPIGNPNLTMLKVDHHVCKPILSVSLICIKAQSNCLRSFSWMWAQSALKSCSDPFHQPTHAWSIPSGTSTAIARHPHLPCLPAHA